jgi:hypothetical protein
MWGSPPHPNGCLAPRSTSPQRVLCRTPHDHLQENATTRREVVGVAASFADAEIPPTDTSPRRGEVAAGTQFRGG